MTASLVSFELLNSLTPCTRANIIPVGRSFLQLFSKQQLTHSATTADKGECEEKEELVGEALLSLDPKLWKQQDHYAVLGISSLGPTATDADIKKAYRKRVLRYHPDKTSAMGLDTDNFFKCIQKAYEVLSDPARKRQYDDADPCFDETIPADEKPKDFFAEYAHVFAKNARFSKQFPVPSLGDMNSTKQQVDSFYNFWYAFESKRTFEFMDEDDVDSASNRDEKRWLEKKNRAARLKRKTMDNERIRRLVDQACKFDPRIIQFKEQEKEEKLRKKNEKQQAAQLAQQEQKRKEEEPELLKKQSEEQARAEKEAAKKQKEADRNAQRKYKKAIKAHFNNFQYFCEDLTNISEIEKMVGKMELLLSTLTLNEMENFHDEFVASVEKEKALNVFEERIQNPTKMTKKEEKREAEKEEDKEVKQEEKEEKAKWLPKETQVLIKAVNLHPGGTRNRWEIIANYVALHANTPTRSQEEIIEKCQEIKQKNVDEEEFRLEWKKKRDARIGDNEPSVIIPLQPAPEAEEAPWSAKEQQLLEAALKSIPSSDPERWEKIAQVVGTRTKKQVVQRFKELAAAIKAKKAANEQ